MRRILWVYWLAQNVSGRYWQVDGDGVRLVNRPDATEFYTLEEARQFADMWDVVKRVTVYMKRGR